MSTILQKIVDYKKEELKDVKRRRPLGDCRKKAADAEPPRDFRGALRTPPMPVIAEIKKASPSLGVIRQDFDPLIIAPQYEEGGAACLSILTDEKFFQGSLSYIEQVKKYVKLPCLRKDFTIDEYHVIEARAHGADSILLIAAILDDHQLKDYRDLAREQGMACLIEVHDRAELERVNGIAPDLIGVNNRDLKTFEVSLENSISLLPLMPKGSIKISESGLKTGADLARLKKAGFDGFLVGESFMKQANPGAALRKMLDEANE